MNVKRAANVIIEILGLTAFAVSIFSMMSGCDVETPAPRVIERYAVLSVTPVDTP